MMEQEINSGMKNQKNQLPEAFSKQISLARLGYLCKDTSGDSFLWKYLLVPFDIAEWS